MRKAFTFIELMICISIIFIIAGLAIPNVVDATASRKHKMQMQDFLGKRLVVAGRIYVVVDKGYDYNNPTRIDAVATDGTPSELSFTPEVAKLLLEKPTAEAAPLPVKH